MPPQAFTSGEIANVANPAFQRWMKDLAAIPAEMQVEVVAKKLKERNAGFDGKRTARIANGAITELRFLSDDVADISPVRALL